MTRDPAPTDVVRTRLADLGTPVDVLRRLPDVDRLVALVGAGWHHGEAVIAWDPLTTATSAFACEARGDAVDPDAFGGGWIGVWGYQLGAELEHLPAPPPRPVPQPLHRIGWYDRVLRRVDGLWWLEQLVDPSEPHLAAPARERFLAALDAEPTPRAYRLGAFAMTPSPDAHVAAVARAISHIEAGDVFQANVTARLEADFDGDPRALFCRGVETLAPAHAAFVDSPEGAVVSLSPELFLRRRGRVVVTSPIKGTAPLTSDPRRLAGSGKDRAENVMVVDLMRNDLGRVAVPGGVTVPAVNRVERHAVWHLVSDVAATLRDDVTDGDLLRATFPPGSVTGTPKIRAMEILDDLETTARESYTGAIGHVSTHAGLELNVAIRTFEVACGRAWLGVGGGIVSDSDPRAELAECFTKALPLLDAVGARLAPHEAAAAAAPSTSVPPTPPVTTPRPVFDTLLVRDGAPVDVERHLARLAHSTDAALGVALDVDALAVEVARHAAPLVGRHRLRVDVHPIPDGVETRVVTSPLGPTPASSTLAPLVVDGGLGAHKWAHRPELDASLGVDRDQLVLDRDGTVLETGRAALLAVVDDEVCAPALDGRQLPSTGRARVEEVLDAAGLPLVERTLTVGDLARASEVLTVNALRSVLPVTGVDGVGRWPVGPVGAWLRAELDGGGRRVRPAPVPAPAGTHVLFVDNYDSFVFNLVQHVTAAGARATVVRNDELGVEELEELCRTTGVTHVVISPGPGAPDDAGVSIDVVRRIGPHLPVLGVCLGHQAIGAAFGADVVRASRPMHGKPCLVHHDGRGPYRDLPDPLVVARYHSLVVDPATLPPELEVTATSPSGVVMGLRHRTLPIEGVQWHPESVLTPVGRALVDAFLRRRA